MNTEFSVVMAAEMKRANQGKLKGPDSSTAGGGDVEGDGEPLLDRAGEEGEENPDKIERLKEEVRQVSRLHPEYPLLLRKRKEESLESFDLLAKHYR